jgi:hypothetical protein
LTETKNLSEIKIAEKLARNIFEMIKSAWSKLFGLKKKSTSQPNVSQNNQIRISAISYVNTTNRCRETGLGTPFNHQDIKKIDDDCPYDARSELSIPSSWSSVYSIDELNYDSIVYISPSSIRYTNSTLNDTIMRISDDELNIIANSVLTSKNAPPKLQIVVHQGFYYAINNSSLQIYKKLEKRGDLTHVQADLVSLKTIPIRIRDSLFAGGNWLLSVIAHIPNFSRLFSV